MTPALSTTSLEACAVLSSPPTLYSTPNSAPIFNNYFMNKSVDLNRQIGALTVRLNVRLRGAVPEPILDRHLNQRGAGLLLAVVVIDALDPKAARHRIGEGVGYRADGVRGVT